MVRPSYVDSNGIKKGAWSEEEDYRLRTYIQRYGKWNWTLMPRFAGLARCGKSCRLRWENYLKPGIKHGNFSKQEEDLILKLHNQLGNTWSAIAAKLPGRTDNEIKNFYHSKIKKRDAKTVEAHDHQHKNQLLPLSKSTSDKATTELNGSASQSYHDVNSSINLSNILTEEPFPVDSPYSQNPFNYDVTLPLQLQQEDVNSTAYSQNPFNYDFTVPLQQQQPHPELYQEPFDYSFPDILNWNHLHDGISLTTSAHPFGLDAYSQSELTYIFASQIEAEEIYGHPFQLFDTECRENCK